MEATIRETGEQGVLLALKDSMAAAQERRRNAQLVAEINTMTAENERLTHIIAHLEKENATYRKELKRYRKQHFEAYRKYIAGEKMTEDEKIGRITRYLIAFAAGMISIMALTMAVMVVF